VSSLLLALFLLGPLPETLTPQGVANASLFHSYVKYAAGRRGIRNVTVIQSNRRCVQIPRATAWVTDYGASRVFVSIRTDVLNRGNAAMMEFLAYHEICHPYLTRRKQPDSEADVDACAKEMYWNHTDWVRVQIQRRKMVSEW
jgi:hypothetical protein